MFPQSAELHLQCAASFTSNYLTNKIVLFTIVSDHPAKLLLESHSICVLLDVV